MGLIPGSGRSPGGGNGNPFQYSCQENPVDRGAWWATVHGLAKGWTRLSEHQWIKKIQLNNGNICSGPGMGLNSNSIQSHKDMNYFYIPHEEIVAGKG